MSCTILEWDESFAVETEPPQQWTVTAKISYTEKEHIIGADTITLLCLSAKKAVQRKIIVEHVFESGF